MAATSREGGLLDKIVTSGGQAGAGTEEDPQRVAVRTTLDKKFVKEEVEVDYAAERSCPLTHGAIYDGLNDNPEDCFIVNLAHKGHRIRKDKGKIRFMAQCKSSSEAAVYARQSAAFVPDLTTMRTGAFSPFLMTTRPKSKEEMDDKVTRIITAHTEKVQAENDSVARKRANMVNAQKGVTDSFLRELGEVASNVFTIQEDEDEDEVKSEEGAGAGASAGAGTKAGAGATVTAKAVVTDDEAGAVMEIVDPKQKMAELVEKSLAARKARSAETAAATAGVDLNQPLIRSEDVEGVKKLVEGVDTMHPVLRELHAEQKLLVVAIVLDNTGEEDVEHVIYPLRSFNTTEAATAWISRVHSFMGRFELYDMTMGEWYDPIERVKAKSGRRIMGNKTKQRIFDAASEQSRESGLIEAKLQQAAHDDAAKTEALRTEASLLEAEAKVEDEVEDEAESELAGVLRMDIRDRRKERAEAAEAKARVDRKREDALAHFKARMSATMG